MPDRRSDPLMDVEPHEDADRYTVDTEFLDRVFDAQHVLAALRSRPLLGPDRGAAAGRIRFVAGVLQELPDDLASTDLFALAGDLALEAGHGEAVDRYLRGASCARRRADFERERSLHLRACRAVARFRGPAAAAGFFEDGFRREVGKSVAQGHFSRGFEVGLSSSAGCRSGHNLPAALRRPRSPGP